MTAVRLVVMLVALALPARQAQGGLDVIPQPTILPAGSGVSTLTGSTPIVVDASLDAQGLRMLDVNFRPVDAVVPR